MDAIKSPAEAQLETRMRQLLLGLKTEQSQKAYVIGKEDVLMVEVWQQPELTRPAKVSQDGSFPYPLLNSVKAAGLTVGELERNITERLRGRFLQDPQVTVSVQQYASKSVYVLGSVPRVGKYPLKAKTTLLEILVEAGGPSPDAGLECIIIRPRNRDRAAAPTLPEEADKEEVFRVSLTDLLAGDLVQNIELQDGDTIFVPQAQAYFVFGEVVRPGKYKFDKGITVLKAVTEAGGPTEKAASLKRVKIIREEGGKKARIQSSPTDSIKPQDIVIVPESFF